MNENEKYHEDTSRISKSGLDLISKAPKKYWERYLNPNRKPQKQTRALIEGEAFHTYVLEPDLFQKTFVVEPHFSGKGARESRANFELNNQGKKIISLECFQMVSGMKDAIERHPIARKLLSKGIAERQFNFTEPSTGARCKIKPDWTAQIENKNILVDLKSTEDASPRAFGVSAAKYRYHVQGAFYSDGANLNGLNVDSFIFIAVEKTPPYLVNVFYLDELDTDLGRRTYIQDCKTYLECKELNEWPGYDEKITPLMFPGYMHE